MATRKERVDQNLCPLDFPLDLKCIEITQAETQDLTELQNLGLQARLRRNDENKTITLSIKNTTTARI